VRPSPRWLTERTHRLAYLRCDLLRGLPGSEREHPLGELGIGGLDSEAIYLEEGEHAYERQALVGVDEGLALGDPVRQDRRLGSEIGARVVGVGARSPECSFEGSAITVPPMIAA
jgi:hypothetical protein